MLSSNTDCHDVEDHHHLENVIEDLTHAYMLKEYIADSEQMYNIYGREQQ